jgi:hypothetical protein
MPIIYDLLTHEILSYTYFKNYMGTICRLNKKQKEIIEESSECKIIQGVRQSGKSLILEFIALTEAFKKTNTTIFLACAKKVMTKNILDGLKSLYLNAPDYLKISVTRWDSTGIEFSNGSKIIVATPNTAYSCGLKIDVLLIDEVAYCNKKELQEFWDSNFQIVKYANRGKVVLASTRSSRSKKNLFWKIWTHAVEMENSFKAFKITSKDCGRTKKDLKTIKNTIGRAAYDREHTIRTK